MPATERAAGDGESCRRRRELPETERAAGDGESFTKRKRKHSTIHYKATETISRDSCRRRRELPATERSAGDGESFTEFRSSNWYGVDMVEIYSVCGNWKQNEKLQWVFLVDTEKGGSLCEVDENISYKGLVESVIEDFGLECLVKDVSLSYELPPRMKLMLEDSLPIHIRNDRQVCTFIKKKQGDPEIIRLCVTELHRSTRNDISVSVPPSDTCSMAEKGQGNGSLSNFESHRTKFQR